MSAASLKREVQLRISDPRILLNEFFGYTSFITGLLTALFLVLGNEQMYQILNQIVLASSGLQNIPLLMVYIPQYRLLLVTGILGIIVTNYFATNPIGNAFREGLFVAFVKLDYSYEALVKYYPEKYKPEKSFLKGSLLIKNFFKYISLTVDEAIKRSLEMSLKLLKGDFKSLVTDAVRSQYFSSVLRIISASPLFAIAAIETLAYFNLVEKSQSYEQISQYWTTVSVRALAFSSFIDGLSKVAFGFMRESFMMKLGGVIFALAQLYLMFMGESSLQLVIPLSLAGLAAYPIVESERLRKLSLEPIAGE
jgi:hypothetical protein